VHLPSTHEPSPFRGKRRRAWGLLLALGATAACGLLTVVPLPGTPVSADELVVPKVERGETISLDSPPPAMLDAMLVRASLPRPPTSITDPEAPRPDPDAVIATPRPDRWLTSRHRRCQRNSGRVYCDGPLRVARPVGPAAELADTLGLGTLQAASHLLRHPPEPDWVDAVEGEGRNSLRWPVDGGNLWRGFGRVRKRTGGRRLHKGVDIGAEPGTPVVAVNDAIVAYSHYEVRGYGNLVMLVHADGTMSMYAHLRSAYVFPGQQVRRGQVIGEVGYTGIARGPHLHFEWRVRGRPRDPVPTFLAVPEDQVSRLPRRSLARRDDSQG
jgi:hypothetical protein